MDSSAINHITPALPERLEQFQYIGKSSKLPEEEMVNFVADLQQQFSAHLATVRPENSDQALQIVTSPQKMLAVLYGSTQALLLADMAAKFVGSMTQGVNRLVTIQ